MDNTHLAEPSPEWFAYDAANPHLDINNIDDPPFDNPSAFRDEINAAREATVSHLLSRTSLKDRVFRRDYSVPARDGVNISIQVYRAVPPHASCSPHQHPPPLSTYIHLHPGGFLLGTTNTESLPLSTWSTLLGPSFLLINISYRHTPEYTYPTQQNDAQDAYDWILAHDEELGVDRSRIIIGGVSSGGNLAARLVLTNTHSGLIKGLVLGMPWLVHRDLYPWEQYGEGREKASLRQCAGAALLSGRRYDLFTDLLDIKEEEAKREFSVGLMEVEQLKAMPPTAVLVCGWDMLRDEGIGFAERLEDSGTPTKKHVFKGMPHSFTKYHELESSRRFDELMVESIRWCLDERRKLDEKGVWRAEGGNVVREEKE